jgi:glycosyl transferase family 22 (putative mannosyltransferase)
VSLVKQKIELYYKSNPIGFILIVGAIVRLVAVVFSKGYGWHDDQFLIIEIAQSWLDGIDYYSWLPSQDGTNNPEGFSFFYVGIHYLLFWIFESIGILNPQTKMLFIRLLHALWSLLIIYYGYLITLRLSNANNAKLIAWIFAVYWIFPMISVRNLVEYTCIPLILYGLWIIVSSDKKTKYYIWLWAGVLFGLAFNIRFQTALITGSFGLVMLIQYKWKEAFTIAMGAIIAIVVFQGGIDYLVWDKPFVQLMEYIDYNMHNAALYIVSPWYTYILFIFGILIPPVSIFLFVGFFNQWKKLLIIFLPILVFLLFHSYYPNKQERFVITIIPMFIIIGIIGWQKIVDQLSKKSMFRKLIKSSWIFFWIINFILLVPVTLMYSKQARVESMSYIAKYGDINNFLIEDINQTVLRFPPQFYLQNWYNYQTLMKGDDYAGFVKKHKSDDISVQPGFVLFYQPDNIELRVNNLKQVYPKLIFEATIEPGFMDRVLYWLNPINDNQNIYIYRNTAVIPDKIE